MYDINKYYNWSMYMYLNWNHGIFNHTLVILWRMAFSFSFWLRIKFVAVLLRSFLQPETANNFCSKLPCNTEFPITCYYSVIVSINHWVSVFSVHYDFPMYIYIPVKEKFCLWLAWCVCVSACVPESCCSSKVVTL